MMVLLSICSSCSYKDVKQEDPFRQLYPLLMQSKQKDLSQSLKDETVVLTVSCHKMPFSVFSRVLSDKFEIGVVFSEKLSEKEITAEFKKTDLQSVMNVVARQLDVDVVRVGNTLFIGPLRAEDRGILVRRIFGYPKDALITLVTSVLSEKGKSSVTDLGVVVAVDHESVIRRLAEMLNYLDSMDQPTWILQLCFVILRRDALLEGGLKTTASGTISYNIADSQVDFKDLKIDGILNAVSNSSYADLYASPMLLCRDGQKAVWKNGQKVPIPRKTVSDYGTVTVSGYDYVDVGFSVEVQISDSKKGSGYLQMTISKSDIESYVMEAPVTSQNVYTATVDMQQMKPYLLGELQMFKDMSGQKDIFTLSQDKGKSVVQVWGQLYKVNGHAKELYKKSDSWEKSFAPYPDTPPVQSSIKKSEKK